MEGEGKMYWLSEAHGLRTTEQKIADYQAMVLERKSRAKHLVECALGAGSEAFSAAAKTPIDGADLLAIIIAAVERGVQNSASNMAKLRHAEHYAMKNDALEYWRQNIDPELSAEKAADQLTGFVNLSHKVLAATISAEKKRISRLRKPEPKRKP
jgi:hypothetical protein